MNMTEKQICDKAKELVNISIELHIKKTLKNYDLLSFFKEHLKELYDTDYCNIIISKYCYYLGKARYEIKLDNKRF